MLCTYSRLLALAEIRCQVDRESQENRQKNDVKVNLKISIAEHVRIMTHAQRIITELTSTLLIIIIRQIYSKMSNLVEQHNGSEPSGDLNQGEMTTYHSPDPMFIRINADNSRPRDILCFWLIFLAVVGLSILLAILVAPKQIQIKSNLTELKDTINHSCMNPCGFEKDTLICNPFGIPNPRLGLMMRHLNILHQFALIYLQFEGESNLDHLFSQSIEVTLYSMKIISQNGLGRFIKQNQFGSRSILLEDSNQTNSFNLYGQKIQHLIGFYQQLSQQNYLLVVEFSNSTQIVKNSLTPTLKAILINPNFTLFVIIVRSVGFFVTLLTGILYVNRYRKLEKHQRSIEQKFVLVMSVMILLFNDPFYFISVLKPNVFSLILSAVLVSQFIAYLFLFWDVLALRILKEQGQVNSNLFTKKKILLLVTYFISYFGVLSWHYSGITIALYEGHFILNPQQISPRLSFVFELWLIINVSIYLMIIIQIFKQDKAVLWRSRSWIYFNIYFAVLLMVFTFFTGSFYEQNSKLLLITFTSLNLYCIYMQYMFTSPTAAPSNQMIPVLHNDIEANDETIIQMEKQAVHYNEKYGRQANTITQ